MRPCDTSVGAGAKGLRGAFGPSARAPGSPSSAANGSAPMMNMSSGFRAIAPMTEARGKSIPPRAN